MVLLACVPLALPFVLLLMFKQNVLRTSIISTVCALAIAIVFVPSSSDFSVLLETAFGNTLAIGFGVLTVLFPGLLLYRLQVITGRMPVITAVIRSLFRHPATQVLALVIGVSPFIEAISGFGVSVLVIAPLLLSLGYSPLKSGVLALLSQISVPLGALGVGTMIAGQLAREPINQVGVESLVVSAPLPVLFALVTLLVGGGRRAVQSFWPVAIAGGLAKAAGDYFLAKAFGIEVAGALASLFALLVIYMLGRLYANAASEGDDDSKPAGVLPAIAPYVLLISALIVTRGITPIYNMLASNFIFDPFHAGFLYPIFYIPGFWVLLAALSTLLVNSVALSDLMSTLGKTWKQFMPAALTIVFFLAIAQIMTLSGMAATVARAGSVLGFGYIAIAPVLGALGGWLTGSNSGGNAMFVPLQVEASNAIGLPMHWTIAAQNAAASYGTMGSPARVTLVSVTLADASIERGLLVTMIRYVVMSTIVIGIVFYFISLQ